jgi:hypothetical protein
MSRNGKRKNAWDHLSYFIRCDLGLKSDEVRYVLGELFEHRENMTSEEISHIQELLAVIVQQVKKETREAAIRELKEQLPVFLDVLT